jgi:beta-glucosidase
MFPKDFVWGFATSSYQIEGAVNEDGRGESIWDRFAHTPGKTIDGTNGDVACDHYHRYAEDVELLRQLGAQAYRFSIAWPRILPQGTGAVNQAGLDFYDRLVDALLKAKITPYVTLYHWDLPQVLEDRGGWTNRETAYAFAEYTEVVVKRLGDRVQQWMTHNEPWCTAFLGYQNGYFAPGLKDLGKALQATHYLLLSHGLAVPVIREHGGEQAKVGIVLNLTPAYPATESPEDSAAVQRFDGFFNRWFLDPVVGRGYPQDMWTYYGSAVPTIAPDDLKIIAAPTDFLGVNYYNRAYLADAPENDGLLHTRDIGDPSKERTADREIYPEGFYDLMTWLHRDYGFPAYYIAENGAAFADQLADDNQVHDDRRVAFLQAHFEQAIRSINAGVPLIGYFVWSLMDNFEWASGYTLRYGITYVDFKTQQRIIKDSGLWVRDFIAPQTA